MKFLILTPVQGRVRTGNRSTADQFARLLRALGHDTEVAESYAPDVSGAPDVLVALHAVKSCAAIAAVRRTLPRTRIVVVLTGTDVYPEPGPDAIASIRTSDWIVGLQERVRARVPAVARAKLRVIVQAAGEVDASDMAEAPVASGAFDICVVAHLREVKDPLRAAAAARLLPEASRIRVLHMGAVIEERYRSLVEQERDESPRYEWLGEIAPAAVSRTLATSTLSVVSSFHEGGARAIGESVVVGTPVLAARNDAALALLGDDYPGLFDAGATGQLADLMTRAESDAAFLAELHAWTARTAAQFAPEREREAWRSLVAELNETPDRSLLRDVNR